MSQKRIKKLKKQEVVVQKNNVVGEKVLGVREILKENWKFLLILCIGVFLLYFNSLHGNFVSDDYATIPNNPMIRDFSSMSNNLIVISNFIIVFLFGSGNPFFFHLYSLMVYLVTVVLAFVFLYMVFNRNIARIGTLIFAVHPIHVEAVSWISGKPYAFFSMFILAGIICFINFTRNQKPINLLYLILCFALAFFTDRPRSFGLLFLIILYMIYKGVKVPFQNVKKWIFAMVFIAIIAVVIMWPYAVERINIVNSGYNSTESVFYNPFFQYSTSISKYLQLLWAPVDLTLYHTMYIFPIWFNWTILLTYISTTTYFFFKDKKYFFALAFIFVVSAPSMAPVKVSWLVAERYIFLGSLGFCLFLALIFDSMLRKYKILSLTIFSLLICFYTIRVYLRNIDWQTNHNLWVNTCQTSPNSHNAWNNIGDDYDKLKQYDNAIKGFTQSTVVKPNYADAYHNRANIFYKTGRLDLARDSYNTALYYSPGLVQTYFSLTQIDFMEKRLDLAINHAKKAVELQPNNPQALYVLGVVYANAGMREEAKKILKPLVESYPQFIQAKQILDQI